MNAKDAARRQAAGQGTYYVEALARGLTIIRAFGRDRSAMTLSDMARAANLPKPTVRRVLHTLVDLGYAETDGRLFQLTPAVLSLAAAYLGTDLVATVLQPVCQRVSKATGEACFVAVLDGQEMVMVAHASTRFPLGLATSAGMRLPAFLTAAGRVLLGLLPDDELERRLKAAKVKANTEFAVTDKAKLKAIILKARADGYCMTQREVAMGFCAVAVPLRRIDGTPVGALSIPALAERVAANPDLLDTYLKVLREQVDTLSQQLI
ncbi:MAG: IclR family transcriptional regulator C-terminal domain-containing protein [Reyranellaceae bacterium]